MSDVADAFGAEAGGDTIVKKYTDYQAWSYDK